jgi:6-phosphogluconolactonase (cycloisomerase 2 family)
MEKQTQMKTIMFCRVSLSVLVVAICLLLPGTQVVAQEKEQRDSGSGRVYVMINQATGNSVVVLNRDADGRLTRLQEVSTGGLGSGPGPLPPPFPPDLPGPDGIDSQDSLVLTEDGQFLIAVNPGSNDVSVLAVTHHGLRLVEKVPSGGVFPVSIAHHRGLIYVLNGGAKPSIHGGGGTPTIRGFRLDDAGKLHEIPQSTIVTGPDASGPSDAVFSPDGEMLVIAEQFTQTSEYFHVDHSGLLHDPVRFRANNSVPLGIAFGRHHIVAITEGGGLRPRVAIPHGSTVSSYRITEDDTLELVSKAVRTEQDAACWIRFTPDGRFAYTGNTGSGSVSSFTVARNGEFTLLASVAADTGGFISVPIDLDITPNGKFLYVLGSFIGTVQGYRIEENGSLTPVTSFSGLPTTMQGIVAR